MFSLKITSVSKVCDMTEHVPHAFNDVVQGSSGYTLFSSFPSLQGRTALHIASMEGHIEVASTLISKASALLQLTDNDGRAPLHLASANGHRELLTILIGQGADIDAQDNVC